VHLLSPISWWRLHTLAPFSPRKLGSPPTCLDSLLPWAGVTPILLFYPLPSLFYFFFKTSSSSTYCLLDVIALFPSALVHSSPIGLAFPSVFSFLYFLFFHFSLCLFYTVMRHITTFWSMMDLIYDNGPIRL
jgi:hypothetical protein